MSNIWLDTNRRKVESIKRLLVEGTYAGSFGGVIDLMDINRLIDGMVTEIKRLEGENVVLKNVIKNASTKEENEN